jgi:hypothetical protein
MGTPDPDMGGNTMPRFRKKPVEVEARKFAGSEADRQDVYAWAEGLGATVRIDPVDGAFLIGTLEGPMRVSPGDWIIRGTRGEFYPCKPGPFADTFEPVTD